MLRHRTIVYTLSMEENHKYWLVILAVVTLALLVRLHDLDRESLFMDEIRQVAYYKAPYSRIVQHAASQQQPPLDYWIGHLVFRYFDSDLAARLPAALFGTASVLILLLLLTRICSMPVAIFFAGLMAILPFHVYYSQEVRPYTIALFFFLSFVFMLEKTLLRRDSGLLSLMLLACACTLLLFSRTLFPLCVFSVSIILVIGSWLLQANGADPDYHRRHTGILLSLVIAFLIYLPVLIGIMDAGQTYLDREESGNIIDALRNLSLAPLWNAFAAQFEPLEYFVLLLVMLGGFSSLLSTAGKGTSQARFYLLLLTFTALLNITVFTLKSSSPFRPPYALYLMPMSVLLSAYGVEVLCQKLSAKISQTRLQLLLMVVALVILASTLNALASFKAYRTKTDWRGLAEYSRSGFTQNNIVIFDSLSKSHNWKPYFYGYYRYSAGTTNLVSSKDLARGVAQWKGFTHKPVLILFHYRDYRLWPGASYILMDKQVETPVIDIAEMQRDDKLDLKVFNGLLVVSPRQEAGRFLRGTYLVHKRVLSYIGESSALVDHLLSLASLSAVCEGSDEYVAYIEKAKELATTADAEHIQTMTEIIEHNRSNYLAGDCD